MKYQKYVGLSLIASQIVGVGCGSSAATSALTSVSLASLPSASSMVSSSTSNVVLNSGASNSLLPMDAGSSFAVTGTAPLLAKLGLASADGVSVDTVFWNGLVAAINSGGPTVTQAQANQFFGITSGGPAGQNACMMAQGVLESVGRMLSAGGSACYMKAIPKATSGVTVTSGSVALANIFDQGAADRLVKISTTGQGQNQDVFIKISGSNTAGASGYKAQLYFCGAGAVTGAESITVDKSSGTYSFTHDDNQMGNQGRQSLTGKLIQVGSTLAFDNTSPRVADVFFGGSFNGQTTLFKGNISVNGGQITSKRFASNLFNGQSNIDKNYSIASVSGSDISTLRFLAGGYKGANTWGNQISTFKGGLEFQSTYYVNTPTSTLATAAGAYDMTADKFYSDFGFAPNKFDGLSCTATPDVALTMDFTNAAVQAIGVKCNGDQIDQNQWNMCYSSTIGSAYQKIFSSGTPPQSN